MRAVLQRVDTASVIINGQIYSKIDNGLLVLLGVIDGDILSNSETLAKKVAELRIFKDENKKMNLSANDLFLDVLVVSNFTLAADCSQGRRPYFAAAAGHEIGIPLYEAFISALKRQHIKTVETGLWGADMKISMINDGPVTILLDTDTL